MHLFQPFGRAANRGREYTVPSLKCIEKLYGKDWRVPKPGFKPWY
uniref:Uncharacterized protein n=1 Tax=Marseillevirus LCMAC103 TaxID=2506604 RepID=A0A481YUV9_9VIRU|nr:MAG: hypothetical protein LCMAC103_01550 [Marseillevirus LCMAC103]